MAETSRTNQELIEEISILNQKIKEMEHSKTDLKQKQAELHESEERFRCLSASAWEGIFIHREGIILDANEAILKMIGCPAEDVIGQSISDFLEPESITPVLQILKASINSNDVTSHFETLLLKKDGAVFPIEVFGKPIRYKNRDARVVAIRNITEKKQAEDALQESRQRFQGLVETLYDWIWEVDPQGQYTYVSPRIKDILGYEPEELLGKTPFEIMPGEEVQRVLKIFGSLTAEQKPIIDLENITLHKDGHLVVMETTGLPFYDSKGNFKGYRGTDRDITGRKIAESKLKASLREKDVLLKEINHRTKNNMQVISSLLSLQLKYVKNEHLTIIFSDIQSRIKSMALVHEMLYKSQDISSIDLREYIQALADSLLPGDMAAAKRISLSLDLDSVIVSIEAAVPCGLAVNEILTNIVKHAFPGGKAGSVAISLHAGPGKEIYIAIKDDGIGMPENYDIDTEGTLGMTLMRNLVEFQLQGSLELQSGRGTLVKIIFTDSISEGGRAVG